MTDKIKDAISVLKEYNEWRRGAETTQLDGKTIGEAIDVVIQKLEHIQSNEFSEQIQLIIENNSNGGIYSRKHKPFGDEVDIKESANEIVEYFLENKP